MHWKLFFPAVTLVLYVTAMPSGSARDYRALYGSPAPRSAATRTIEIRPDTRYVNVTGGDTVRFVVGDRSFAWQFNVAVTVGAFDLNEVAPAGVLQHTVRAYVDPDPKYLGG